MTEVDDEQMSAPISLDLPDLELLAWCALAVASSVSYHRLSLPESGTATLLAELITATIDAPIVLPPRAEAVPDRPARLTPQSRRQALLNEAMRLFARDGFAGVSMEDIGAGIGIAGPSVYNHFAVKSDLLTLLNDLPIIPVHARPGVNAAVLTIGAELLGIAESSGL
ncbi:TetR family transcriptional regulator [Nocardia sp. SYP-A9097]|nr:TetR family transcriptional regulator [Nocardia sp. SYP-A9097]